MPTGPIDLVKKQDISILINEAVSLFTGVVGIEGEHSGNESAAALPVR
jgi:hypothetical protein